MTVEAGPPTIKGFLDAIRYEEVDQLIAPLLDLSRHPTLDGDGLTTGEIWKRAVEACLDVLDERLTQLCAG